MNKPIAKIVVSVAAMVAISNYGMQQQVVPREIHNHIASYVLGGDNDALQSFDESGWRPNKNNEWSANQAWSVLGFMQKSLIRGHYIRLSSAEVMKLTKKQRLTLKEVYKTKKEYPDYSSNCGIPRSMFTTLRMTSEQKTTLEQCPNHMLRVFLGRRNEENTHRNTAYEVDNHMLIPENQDIYVIVDSPVVIKEARGEFNAYPYIDSLCNAFCSGNMGKIAKDCIRLLQAYVDSEEFYYWSRKDCILTNKNNTYYFAPFTLTNDGYQLERNWGRVRLDIQHPTVK